jgi:hypothetical protein
MVAFPQLLEYTTTRIDLMVDCDGNARLVDVHDGARREWTAKVQLARLHAAWASLEQSGFTSLPASEHVVIAHRADGRKERGGGSVDALAILDGLAAQIIHDQSDAVVTNIVRITG